MTKEQLRLREKEIEEELKEVKKELRYLEIPKHMMDAWKLMFGWPEISCSLGLREKLGKETYDDLYEKVSKKIEEIARMVPDYDKREKDGCEKCRKIKS